MLRLVSHYIYIFRSEVPVGKQNRYRKLHTGYEKSHFGSLKRPKAKYIRTLSREPIWLSGELYWRAKLALWRVLFNTSKGQFLGLSRRFKLDSNAFR